MGLTGGSRAATRGNILCALLGGSQGQAWCASGLTWLGPGVLRETQRAEDVSDAESFPVLFDPPG